MRCWIHRGGVKGSSRSMTKSPVRLKVSWRDRAERENALTYHVTYISRDQTCFLPAFLHTHLARTTSRPLGLIDMDPTLSSTLSESGLPNVGELNTDRGWPSFDIIVWAVSDSDVAELVARYAGRA